MDREHFWVGIALTSVALGLSALLGCLAVVALRMAGASLLLDGVACLLVSASISVLIAAVLVIVELPDCWRKRL